MREVQRPNGSLRSARGASQEECAPDAVACVGTWPDGRLAPKAPPEARQARANAAALREALQGRSIREVADEADLAHTTVYDLLAGKTYGDVITLARLEAVLGTPIWTR